MPEQVSDQLGGGPVAGSDQVADTVSGCLLYTSDAAESITPPRWWGWFAITPTGWPFRRTRAVTMLRAQRGESSSIELESATQRITERTS